VPLGPRRILTLLIAAGALLAVVSAAGDVRELGSRLVDFGWWAFGAALALSLANYAIRFVRWTLYLRRLAIEVPPVQSGLVFIAGFALAITPGKVGELVKSYLLRELRGVPVAHSAPIVVAERITDLVALVILAAVGVAAYGVATEAVIAGAAVLAFGLIVLAWPRMCHALVDLVTAPRFLHRFRDRGHTFYDGIASLVRPVPLAWGTALGVAAWACECVGFAVVLAAFPGTDVPLGLSTLIYAASTIAGALSFLPGGLGVTEAGMAVLLVQSHRGVDDATAVAASLLIRFATLWFAVALGLVAMTITRRLTAASADRAAILRS
jgi:glycosyltransferase 2 family protein